MQNLSYIIANIAKGDINIVKRGISLVLPTFHPLLLTRNKISKKKGKNKLLSNKIIVLILYLTRQRHTTERIENYEEVNKICKAILDYDVIK